MPTHGSLTKAGKVRGQTPKIEGKKRVSPISKLRNKINFVKRFEKDVNLDKENQNVQVEDVDEYLNAFILFRASFSII